MPFKLGLAVEEARYSKVDTYADLPIAGDYTGDIYIVLTATGIWGVSRKRSGMWRSDGANWNRLGVVPMAEDLGAIVSSPPDGMQAIKRMYYDPNLDKVIIEKEV